MGFRSRIKIKQNDTKQVAKSPMEYDNRLSLTNIIKLCMLSIKSQSNLNAEPLEDMKKKRLDRFFMVDFAVFFNGLCNGSPTPPFRMKKLLTVSLLF